MAVRRDLPGLSALLRGRRRRRRPPWARRTAVVDRFPGGGRDLDDPATALLQVDRGYDVSDYCGVDPLFGTLKELESLLEQEHGLGCGSCSTSPPTTATPSTRCSMRLWPGRRRDGVGAGSTPGGHGAAERRTLGRGGLAAAAQRRVGAEKLTVLRG